MPEKSSSKVLTLIQAKDIALIRGQRLLFKNLSFSLYAGEAIYLSGHNGSGKTSLLKILTGLLMPCQGKLEIFGQSVNQLSAENYQQLLYLGHQSAIKSALTVTENIYHNCRIFDNITPTENQMNKALTVLGLESVASQLAGHLSAGQQRRVMLARLWIGLSDGVIHQKIWLLDEVMTALDSNMIEILQCHIDQYLSLGGAVIFTSHQPLKLSHIVKSVQLSELTKSTSIPLEKESP